MHSACVYFIRGEQEQERLLFASILKKIAEKNKELYTFSRKSLLHSNKNHFKPLFPREIDEAFYTKPPKNDVERMEQIKNPRKLRTRLMFCDLLEDFCS